MGRFLIIAGIFLIVAGFIVIAGDKVGIRLGRLPGDIRIQGKNGGFYFPIVTCIIISVVLSLIGWLVNRR